MPVLEPENSPEDEPTRSSFRNEKEILETDATTIAHIGSIIQSYLHDEDQEYYPYITHKGVEYQIVDIEKITFGLASSIERRSLMALLIGSRAIG